MIQLFIIAIYLGLLLWLGLFSNRLFRGTREDYMLASHSIGPFLLLMSLFGTTMTAFALVGSTGESFKEGVGVYGMLASSSGIIHSLCFFLLGVKLWSFGCKYGYTTQIQFFRDRLESDKIGLLLFPILVGLVIPYLLIGVLSAGTVINAVTEGAFTSEYLAEGDYGVPYWAGSLVICGVVLLYVFFGGMRGTAWANTFQTLVFMVLGLVTFFVIAHQLGGLRAASEAVKQKHPGKLMRYIPPEEIAEFERQFDQWAVMAEYNWAVKHDRLRLTPEQIAEAHAQYKPRQPGWQRIAEALYANEHDLVQLPPDEQQKARIAQDDRQIPSGVPLLTPDGSLRPLADFPRVDSSVWQNKAKKIFAAKIGHPRTPLDPDNPDAGNHWTRRKAFGVYKATSWAPERPHTLSTWKFLTYLFVPLSVGMFPHLFQHWLTAKSAKSFKLPVVAHPIFIMIVWVPCVLVGIWATSAVYNGKPLIPPHFPANAVLAKMVAEMTTPLLAGLLTAGILAAIMSSLDSQFLCIGTIFTEDIVRHYAGKERFSEQQTVLMARLFIVGIVVVTYAFSLAEPRRVFTMGVWCFSGFSSLFPLILAALYWRRLTKAGAYAGIMAAFGSWSVLFYLSGFGKNPHFDVFGTMPVATMVLCSTLAIVLVSLITRPPSEATLAKFFPAKDSSPSSGLVRV
jgi:SSS family solute:Na+ symporter